MTWFFAVLVVLLMGAVAVVASGRGGSLGEEYADRPDVPLPEGRPVTGADLRALRLNTAVRGYRADEVDALIERLAAQLDGTDAAPVATTRDDHPRTDGRRTERSDDPDPDDGPLSDR